MPRTARTINALALYQRMLTGAAPVTKWPETAWMVEAFRLIHSSGPMEKLRKGISRG